MIKTSDYNTWNGGIRVGAMKYYGDVRQLRYSPENKYKKTNTTFAFEVGKSLNHIFGLRANALFGGLSGSNPDMNLHFTNSFKELNLAASVNLNNLISFYPQKSKIINTYIYFGGGAIFYHSLLKSFDEDIFVNGWGYDSLGNKSGAKMAFTMPFGIGIKFKADEQFDIGIETQLHLINSDNLDAYTGQSLYNDRFGFTSISLIYKFGNKKEYVEWVKPNIESFASTYYADNAKKNTNDSVNKSTSVIDSTVYKSKPKADTVELANQKANKTKTTVNKTTETTTISVVNKTKSKTDSSEVAIKANTNTTKITTVSENYFIQAGTYKTKKLAKEAVQKYQGKGYSEAKLLGETSGGNIRVCIKSFETAEEAAKDYASIKKVIPSAKLLQKKSEKTYTDITSKASSLIKTDTVTPNTTKSPDSLQKTTTNIINSQLQAPKTIDTNKTTTNKTAETTAVSVANTTNQKADSSKAINQKANTTTANKTTETTTVPVANKTKPKTDSSKVINQANINTTKTTTVSGLAENYFIQAGTYKTKKLAKDAVKKYQGKGYPEAKLLGETSGGNIRVCIKSFETAEEAAKEYAPIKKIIPSAKLLQKKSEKMYTDITSKVSSILKDAAAKKTTPSVTTSNTSNIQPEVPDSNSTFGKRFFIIAGSFGTEDAAQAEVESLKSKGLAEAVVVGKDDAGNYNIAYKAYATSEEANKDLPFFKSYGNYNAWIFEKK